MSGDTTYLILSALWSIGGLAVGYILGRNARGDNKHRLVSRETLVSLLVIAIISTTIGMYVKQADDLARQADTLARVADCQAQQARQTREALTARADIEARQIDSRIEQNDAQLQLLTTPPSPEDPRAGLAAIGRYVDSVRRNNELLGELKATRAQNPLPDLTCGVTP